MAKVNLDAQAAAQAVNEFLDAVSAIKSTLSKVGEDTEWVITNGFKGTASKAMHDSSIAWNEEATRLNNKLDAMTEQVQEGNQTLENVNADNAAALTNLV
ncbi:MULTISPECIES: WXG100 family type VII secretion target [Nocardia]|uniref:WXG100 family type VII secretion target n=1 Tax=Nocardia TaxID=1817 RepID=UPI001894B131|nr:MULTISPECIES: WXG100 family type VII secretion target [Nocardia]MBF6179639.1 WXG100 family type VII secretion target [Nocardia otitidiscaviarum]